MTQYRFAEHTVIVALLAGIDHEAFQRCRCYFGGGTAVVLTRGEYRLSRDIDFLCADQAGYREMRLRLQQPDLGHLFPSGVVSVRDVRADQYGIRTILSFRDMLFRFEIIREARIPLSGGIHPVLMTPILRHEDLVAEKLLANADRGDDPATAQRDAIDLGMLVGDDDTFGDSAVAIAEAAYGVDVRRKALAAAARLASEEQRSEITIALSMMPEDTDRAVTAFRRACARRWGDQPAAL